MACNKKFHLPKIELSRAEIFFARVKNFTCFFYLTCDGRFIILGNVKFFNGRWVLILKNRDSLKTYVVLNLTK